jgi:hypothetical protein
VKGRVEDSDMGQIWQRRHGGTNASQVGRIVRRRQIDTCLDTIENIIGDQC